MSWYVVYDTKTDEVLANGTISDCAKSLGVKYRSFQHYVNRARKGIDMDIKIVQVPEDEESEE